MLLTVEQSLLLKAAQEEADKEAAMQAASLLGGAGGALAGSAVGTPVHLLGKGLDSLRGRKPIPGRPGARFAGALTGALLGGSLGPGVVAITKQESPAARLLAKIQTSGEITENERKALEDILALQYSNQSQMA